MIDADAPPDAKVVSVEFVNPDGPNPRLVGVAYDCGCQWREAKGMIIRNACGVHR